MSDSLAPEKRGTARVEFSRGVDVHMVAIDGTWSRQCQMTDVAEAGAKLKVEGSIKGLALKEFFLLLSTTGAAFRRCELAWINGDYIGVHFLRAGKSSKG
ncbi:PilZ domain-containing protein [Bradyrhizobium sp. KB893862 SZCCT0404]|uniref:PilZ domain-containing protein n=1 Tax=Bradyrhizobium sp. KB893862 SZCCT0404 TaxID=2807672 RepID=UPI001BA549DB|nr:PilZ domain-containing protein [Bradyrhizobium sp. KB893862 SZCCT0404]MBR1179803.1 PilZ domain-containing protein [Bradyrhizobium sp. KB893862 SZCCT0404]